MVALLFCHKLVATRSLDLVPGNRRFEATQYQDAILSESGDFENEIGLVDRVQATSSQDQVIFAGSSEDELPYDYSNNVNFADTDGVITVAGSSVSANSEKKKKKAEAYSNRKGASVEKKGLARGHDELGLPRGAGLKRKAADSLARSHECVLELPRKKARLHRSGRFAFLIEMDKDGDVKMGGSPWRKAKGNLSF